MSCSLNTLYRTQRISKQAVAEHFRAVQAQRALIRHLLPRVDAERARHPGCGLEKLYWKLRPAGIGRDKFCGIFMALGYGVRPARRRWRTTFAVATIFENLIESRLLTGPNQVWQSDTTYIRVGPRWGYLTFIMDVYTREILGYASSQSLRAEANLQALKQALGRFKPRELLGLIHHSDRGRQYHSTAYLQMLRHFHIRVSMGQQAQDNAYAERINGIIKAEYIQHWVPRTFTELKRYTSKAVGHYNRERLHRGLDRMAPSTFVRRWKHQEPQQRRIQIIYSLDSPKITQKNLSNYVSSAQGPICVLSLN